jgi:hypothetical protein
MALTDQAVINPVELRWHLAQAIGA